MTREITNWSDVIEKIKRQDVAKLAYIFPEFKKENIKGQHFVLFCSFHKKKLLHLNSTEN